MESEHAEVDQNTNNSNRDNASSDASSSVFQTPTSNENNLTPYLNLQHHDQLETHFGDPETEVRIPVNSEVPGHTQAAYSMFNISNNQQYDLQGAKPKDLPDKLQRPKDSSGKNNLAKDLKISKSVNPSTEEQELRKNKKLKQRDSSGSQFVTSQPEKDINVNNEVLINLKDKQIDKILKLVCACLNIRDSQTRTLKLRNIHCDSVETKNLDDWYDKVEKKMKEVFFTNIADYVELKGHCNSEVLELIVKPGPNFCTIDMHLFFPSVSSADPAKYKKVVEILRQDGVPGSLPTIPNRTYKLNHKVKDLRNENTDTQFKQITGKDVSNTLANMCSHYISAFGNHKGGVVYYGIEDKKGIVVGIDLSNCTETAIESALDKKIGGMICGKSSTKLKRTTHWDIQYFNIEEDEEANIFMQNRKIIAVKVCRIPGGVFTAVPESYYVDDDGSVKQFNDFEEWRSQMLSSDIDILFTQRCGAILQTSVDNLFDEVSDTKKTVHQTKRGVLNMTEMLSDTASNVSVLKDLVESGSLSSDKQKRSRGTEVLQDENCENFQVPSNLFEHHVTHDYKSTRNDTILQDMLEKHNCVTVKGYIGTGKSQLALNYGLTMKKDNTLVWKFDCSNIRELWRSTAYLLKELQYKIKDTENKKDDILFMAKTINEYLEKNHTSLHILIFEDVIDDSRNVIETFINVYLAKRGNLKVLVTSFLSVTEIELEIDGFSKEEAISFIDALEATDAEREELVKTFSCNPLGLKIALRYITHCQISVRAFLGKLSLPTGALDIENSPAISQRCELKLLFQSLHLILSDIHQKNPRTLERILLMQFLGSDNIPVIMLENVRLNFGSHELKQEGICNSTSDTIDDVISTLKQYSFARISGKDDTRVLHTHSAILLAIKNYTSEAVKSNDLTVADMLKALLWTVVCLMNKDNRITADLEGHTYLLPYAESILNHTHTLLGNTEEANTFQDISFSLPLVYVSDIVGYTYDFDEMYHFGETYFKVAESYLMKMVGISVPIICATEKDIQIKSKKTATQLHQKMSNIYKQNTKMLNTVGQWYILNKYRSKEELEVIQTGLHRAGKKLNGKLKNEQDLNLLHENKLAVPKKMIGYFFFFEVVISFLYSFGRRLFLTVQSDIRHNCYFLHIANHLSNIVHELNPKWKMVHHLLTQRSGTIQLALTENSELPKTDLKELKEIAKKCLRSLAERNTYFLFGIIFLETESDGFNKVIWLKQLVRCYKTMLGKAKDETEKEEIKQQGQEHVKHLEQLIKAFEHTSAFPTLLLSIGEFYQSIRDFKRAKTTFKKLFPKLTQADQKVKTRKHERQSYIYYLQCLLLELKDTRSEQIESEAYKEIEILVPRCYKFLINHHELKELEELLFMSEQERIIKHEERACVMYLNSRLSYLQYGGLNGYVYNRHVTEITDLLHKFSKMPVNHTESGLEDMRVKLSDLRNKHNS